MELRQLRAFLEVATLRHFGHAATVLKITQPALTQRIQALERELGVQLLTRSAREVQLTRSGDVLLPYARSLVQIEDRALRELAENAAGRAGHIRIAYLSQGDTMAMGKIVAEFRRRYPPVTVETSSGHSSSNVERLNDGDVDAAFVATPLSVPETIVIHPIVRYELMLVLPQGHSLARLDRVPVRDLRGEPLVLTPMQVNPKLQSALRSWLATHTGGELNVVAEEPADQAVETVINSGAASFVSGRAAQQPAPTQVAYRSLVPAPLVQLAIGYQRDNPSPVLANLIQVITELAPSLRAELPEDGEPI
jgi:DNA-binding transcriptional LysR family regulator